MRGSGGPMVSGLATGRPCRRGIRNRHSGPTHGPDGA